MSFHLGCWVDAVVVCPLSPELLGTSPVIEARMVGDIASLVTSAAVRLESWIDTGIINISVVIVLMPENPASCI